MKNSSTSLTGFPSDRAGWFRWLAFAAVFVALSAAVPYAIWADLDASLTLFDDRLWSWPFALACLGLLIVYFCCDGLRLFFVLRALGYDLPLRALGQLVFINILVSNITPMATGGGLAQIWYLRREGVHLGAATAATTLRTLLASLLIFIPAPLLLLFLDALQRSPLQGNWSLYLGVFAALYLGFFALVLLRRQWFIRTADALLALLERLGLTDAAHRRRRHFAIRREMMRFAGALRSYLRGPARDRLLSVVFTALFLLSLFSFPALLLWALGYTLDYPTVVGLVSVTTFIMYFAPTPGAAGIAEGAFGLLFAQLVSNADLVLVILAWRFLTIHLGMLIGVPVSLHALAREARSHG